MPHRSSVVSVLAGLLLFLLMGSAAGAATLTVNTLDDNDIGDNKCSLREAITAANNNRDYQGCTGTNYGDDTIRFDVSGIIALASSLPILLPQVLTIDGAGQTITISGSNSAYMMTVSSGAQLTLENLKVTKGNTAIFNIGNLTVTNSTFSNNHSDALGGAINNYYSGSLTVTNSTFSNNSAPHFGGAIYNNSSGTITVTNSTFSGNSSENGGGILNFSGIINITSSIFSSNSAAGTGGSIANHGTLTVTDSTFTGNNTNGSISAGGGIYNDGTLAVTSSTFSNNSTVGTTATAGGGIANDHGTLTVANSTFFGNSTNDGYGGGISNGGTLTVTNSTFSGNSANASSGGNLFNSGVLTLSNTILANSLSGDDCASSGGTINASGVNLVMDGTCGSSFPSNTDPQLGPLADNGGPTQTMALLPGSPALDAADDTICAAAPVSGLDQRGVTRPQGTHCDIGAYEFMLTPTTTTLNADPTSPVYGQTVTLTATVSPTTATGTVSFQDGSTPLVCMGGNQTLNGGTATCSLNSFPVGTYSDLTAIYGGDSTHAASQGTTSLTVNQANTTTTLTSDNPDPSAVNGVVTVSYGVAVTALGAGTPTGNVTVSDGVDNCVGSVAAGGCAITLHSVGPRTLTASYAGDGNFTGSMSTDETHLVLAITAQGDAGGGPVTATITSGTCIGFANGSTSFTAAPTPLPIGVTFPYGVFGFTAICPSDGTGTLTLTLTYPHPLPTGTQYWKYGPTADDPNPHWYVLLPATLDGNTATFTITDGGLGDDDLVADGDIEDQGGPGIGPGATGIPTLSEWALLLMMGLLGLVLGITVRRRAPPDRPV
jgi:CSLREA domain-containing protein